MLLMHEAASPACASTFRLSYKDGMQKKQHHHCNFAAAHGQPQAWVKQAAARVQPGRCSSRAEVCKGEKSCLAQQPLEIYLPLQQRSQQSLRVWEELADHGPTKAAGSWDGPGQGWVPSFPMVEEGLGEWGWGKSTFYLLCHVAAAFNSSWTLSFTYLLIKLI